MQRNPSSFGMFAFEIQANSLIFLQKDETNSSALDGRNNNLQALYIKKTSNRWTKYIFGSEPFI